MSPVRIGIIGAGNMGEALIRGLRQTGKTQLIASDKDKKRRDYIRKKYRISATGDNLKVVASSTVVILAVKPQDIEHVLAEVSAQRTAHSAQILFISIAAGITTKHIESFLGKVSVVRVMPNAPALIGNGVSAVCLGKYAKVKDYRKAETLFKTVGEVIRIEEGLMDNVTAISGSGPAYFFLLIKCLTDSAVKLGLNRMKAERLVNHTARGSLKMLIKTKQSPQALIARVASKGGTTEAALEVFAKEKWERIIDHALKAAVRRARELGRN